jgi:cytochrome c556
MKTRDCVKPLLLVLLLVVSISGAGQQRPALHGIYSEKLKTVMLRMNQLVFEREMTALQVLEEREQHLQQLIDAIADLVRAAEALTDAVPGIALIKEDQVVFRAMANQLYREAQAIGVMVEEKNYSALDPAYQRLNETCNACHSLFRL